MIKTDSNNNANLVLGPIHTHGEYNSR